MRVNLSVAIVAMTENRTVELPNGTIYSEQLFDWNSRERGFALAAFFYGYITTQLIGGYIANRVGGRLVSNRIATRIVFQPYQKRFHHYQKL